jgi:Putative peptidoglycan binding domain
VDGVHAAISARKTTTNLKRFQKAHGLRADGVYGPATHAALMPYYDKWGRNLYGAAAPHSTRQQVVETARHYVSIEPRVHYTPGAGADADRPGAASAADPGLVGRPGRTSASTSPAARWCHTAPRVGRT